MRYKNLFHIALLFLAVLLSKALVAQTSQDLKTVQVDQLSDTQIRQYLAQMKAAGLTEDQVEQVAKAKGMPDGEIIKLKARVANLGAKSDAKQNGGGQADLKVTRDVNTPEEVEKAEGVSGEAPSKIFGASLFAGKQLTFEPNLRMATPRNYVIGPDDELLIDIYGNSEANYRLKVSPEGNINVQYVGVIQVGGMTVEQAIGRIRERMSTIYSGLRDGGTRLNIAIGNIRSIKVVLTGEVKKPGTYTLPSLATVFNALYMSGGPTENGSFRQIELIRGGNKVATMDIYDFLLTGAFKNNVRLQDQDVIRVPAYQRRVEIAGEVKHPGIFEMKIGEHLSDLLRFASGFTDKAYKARIKVLRNTDTEHSVNDITSDAFSSYAPKSGDNYIIDVILDRFENRVTINGSVFRPGQFELTPGLTLRGLVQKAEGLKEDAFMNRAYITRLKANNDKELVSFDLEKVLSGEQPDIVLKREDIINISSIFDLKEEYNFTVAGEVRNPGSFKYAEGMSLEDAILQAGGLKESATVQRVEISRRIKNSDPTSEKAVTAKVFQVDISRDLKNASNFKLQPFDIVSVRESSGYETQRQVTITGEVLYPGVYTLTTKDERISDLLKRAGGFTAYAYPEGASLKRPLPASQAEAQMEAEKMRLAKIAQESVSDTMKLEAENLKSEYVGINLPRILKHEKSKYDVILQNGDILSIPTQLQTVKVGGEVLAPATVLYATNKGFKRYINNAGGFGNNAKRKAAYIIYANGSVESTSQFLFFRNYPVVKPGAQIVVPKKPVGRKLSVGELTGIGTGFASIAAIIISLLK